METTVFSSSFFPHMHQFCASLSQRFTEGLTFAGSARPPKKSNFAKGTFALLKNKPKKTKKPHHLLLPLKKATNPKVKAPSVINGEVVSERRKKKL